MKQATKRILSALLVLCMILSVLPASVFAAPESEKTIKVQFRYFVKQVGGTDYSQKLYYHPAPTEVTVKENGTFDLTLPAGYKELAS